MRFIDASRNLTLSRLSKQLPPARRDRHHHHRWQLTLRTAKCDPADLIMSDKPFNVQGVFDPFSVKVNILYFLCIYNRLPVIQRSMFSSSNQDLVAASSRRRRPAKPPGAYCITQSTTTCYIDLVSCPQALVADSCVPQRFIVSQTRALPQCR